MESFQVYINSKNAISVINYNYNFNLPQIDVADNCYLFLSVQYASIPYSFYNVNVYNNLFIYSINDVSYTLNIDVGNYNINQLIDYINNNTDLVLSYNTLTNKITFTNSNNEFILSKNSNCLELFGFKNNLIDYYSSNKSLTSVYCVNLLPIQMIYITTNYTTYNFNQGNSNDLNILCAIPVNTSPNSLIIYKNENNYRTNLLINNINNISIKLLDQNNNNINLNGLDFNLVLQFDIIQFN